jgi:4-amino-4-deoxy-L-arabinose transferase-like glycosyltransferase
MSIKKSHRGLFYLSALEGAVVIAALLSIPSEGGTLSPARLALLFVTFILSTIWIVAGLRFSDWLNQFARPRVVILFAVLALTVSLILFLLRYLNPEHSLSFYQRLSPLLWYFVVICIQMAFYILYLSRGIHPQNITLRRPIYSYAVVAFGSFLFLYLFVAVTRLGVTFDPAYWGEPGVPLMGWQFGLALTGGLLVLCVGLYNHSAVLDIFLPISIYFLMLILCLSVPLTVLKNSFYMPIAAPEHTPFPYADSAYYDQMSQSLLIGHPYQGVIPTRPLYILFLTILHLLFGQNYFLILLGQTFVLAFLPVLLYFIAKKLHSRTAGVIVALFFIFREFTSLLISSETRVTNTKMILVDLPTLFLLLLACIFVFRWLERKDAISAFAAGGMFGILLLLRTQSLFMVPFVILVAFFVLGWRSSVFYRQTAVFITGLAITILPWLVHNYLVAGAFAFDADFQTKLLVDQYRFQGNEAIQNLNVQGMGMARILIEFALRDPKHVFGFIANHFLATQINGLLVLPLIEPFNGLFAPINLYWMNWDGQLAWYNALLLPMAFSIGYALATAASRYSSWRYDYPSDWVWYFYFGIGFAELLHQSAMLFGARELDNPLAARVRTKQSPVRQSMVLALLFILIGVSPWLITKLASPRYADQSRETLAARVDSIPNAPTAQEISAFLSQANSFFQSGRLLYPRFFRQNTGLSSANPSPAFAIRDYSRLGFLLLNQKSIQAVFATKKVPGLVPHASDVIVLGCQQADHVDVRLLALPALDAFYLSAPLTAPCSP